jgi:UPF0755 protein
MRFLKALVMWTLVLAMLAGAGAAAGWVWLGNELGKPGPLAEETVVKVEPGETLSAVAARLDADGVISDARIMRLKARIDGTELAIKSGEFIIEPRASVNDVLSILIEGRAVLHRITLPEGRTTAQILKMIAENEVLTGDMPEVLPAEGTLLPDTYMFHRGMTRQELIEKMQKAQADLLTEYWPKRQADLPIATPYEAVILASVVEKETGRADERPLIAGLFTARLKKSMRLQSDPTIIYGISKGEPLYNKQGQRRTLYRSEIDRPTDWNTYQIDGLPKTPICNPGADAIKAVLDPPDTDYLFFVADGKGGHLFAKTNDEHNRNVAAYRSFERQEIQRERAN